MADRQVTLLRLRWVVLWLVVCLVVLYISSYIVLSRRGFAQADAWQMEGFYFLTPENTDEWRCWNSTCVRIYFPLILIDNVLGTGRPVASEPLWGFEGGGMGAQQDHGFEGN